MPCMYACKYVSTHIIHTMKPLMHAHAHDTDSVFRLHARTKLDRTRALSYKIHTFKHSYTHLHTYTHTRTQRGSALGT